VNVTNSDNSTVDPARRPPTIVPPPETILIDHPDTPVLRRARVEFAEALARSVEDNLDHLRPWMPWATPESADATFQRERLANVELEWEAGNDYQFVLMCGDEVIGSPGVMTRRGPNALDSRIGELGYWLAQRWNGRGIMTATARALTDYALSQVSVTMIVCDAANERSNAIARRLGYRLDRSESREPRAPAETGVDHIWVRHREG
jgi:RimJ/RimL family protein N-acetyltransferase